MNTYQHLSETYIENYGFTSSHICQLTFFFIQRKRNLSPTGSVLNVPPLGHRSKAVDVLPDQWEADRWEAPEKTQQAVGF